MDRKKVRELNDAFRESLQGGRVLATASLANHPRIGAILHLVRTFSNFGEHNDPYQEHDMGFFSFDGEALLFKIDYFDPDMENGSLDPSDVSLTQRVLTIMRADEY
jgi:hypothetical protein